MQRVSVIMLVLQLGYALPPERACAVGEVNGELLRLFEQWEPNRESGDRNLFAAVGAYPDVMPAAEGSWSFLLTSVKPDQLRVRLVVNGQTWAIGQLVGADGDAALVHVEYPTIPSSSVVSLEVVIGQQPVRSHPIALTEMRPANAKQTLAAMTEPGVLVLRPDSSHPLRTGAPLHEVTCSSPDLLRVMRLLDVTELHKMPLSDAWGFGSYKISVRGTELGAACRILQECDGVRLARVWLHYDGQRPRRCQ